MTREHMANVMEGLFESCRILSQEGHKEYTLGEDAFGNFNRLAKILNIPREKILLIYFMKHIDGIFAYVNGHESQRESVHGRIKDAIVYLSLLHGMIVENNGNVFVDNTIVVSDPPQGIRVEAPPMYSSPNYRER